MSRFGGWGRIDRQRLRKAILEADLGPMIRADPTAAAELVRETVLDPEARSRATSPWEEPLGITGAPFWMTAAPERGPFLLLLQVNAEVGLNCIIDLVEHATERWVAAGTDTPENPFADSKEQDLFEIVLEGKQVRLVGDANVLHWHRNDGHAPVILACALMAIESYLYRRLDSDESIDAELERLKRSRSLAIWGVLTEVARYKPALLRDQLAPLLSSAALLLADKLYAIRSQTHLNLAGIGDRVFGERSRSWNAMPHRKTPILEPLMRDVLTGEALADELSAARERWHEQDPERWKHLIAQTDPANHSRREFENGAVVLEYVPPEELRDEVEESNQEAASAQFWINLPYRIREWIDKGIRPEDEAIEEFWNSVQQRLGELPADDEIFSVGVRRREDLESGIAALLVLRAREWLRSHPDREQWCRQALLSPFEGSPPPTHPFDSPGEMAIDTWDSFCAEALPVLLAEDPADTELRSAVARLAIHPHRLTVRKAFFAVSRQAALAETLRELEHVSLSWARFLSWRQEVRHRERHAELDFGEAPSVDSLPDLETPTREALEDFTSGQLSPAPRLRTWLEETPDSMLGPAMDARHRALSKLDLAYLIAARSYLPISFDDAEKEGRERRVEFATELAEHITTGLIEEGTNPEGPFEEENAAYTFLAEMTLSVPVGSARRIWGPILALGGTAQRWVDHFLGDLWGLALSREVLPPGFPVLIKEMITFATNAPNWRQVRDSSELCLRLAGLRPWPTERHASLVEELLPEWEEWVRPKVKDAWFTRGLLQFLTRPTADPVRAEALAWLAARERGGQPVNPELDEMTSELLLVISVREPRLLRGNDEPAFNGRYLLSRLAGRGQPLAVELSARLG